MAKKSDTAVSKPNTDSLTLHEDKNSPQGLLLRLLAAIMEHNFASLEAIYVEATSQKIIDKRIVCLSVLGMMHIVNVKPIIVGKTIVTTAQRFKLYQTEITTNKEFQKFDNKKYFVYSFKQIIETFINNSLGNYISKEVEEKRKLLLSLTSTGGVGRSYRFNLNQNLPGLLNAIKTTEDFFLLLLELPIQNANVVIQELAFSFLDEGKHQVLTEEKFFQPSSPSVSTTAIWHNYIFLRDDLFVFSLILDKKVLDGCHKRNIVWNYIQRYMIERWQEEKTTWYLSDIRKRFKKEKMLRIANSLYALVSKKTNPSVIEIQTIIEEGLLKK